MGCIEQHNVYHKTDKTTGWAKKLSPKFLSISSPNIDGSSKSFHCHILWNICNKVVTKNLRLTFLAHSVGLYNIQQVLWPRGYLKFPGEEFSPAICRSRHWAKQQY